MKMLLVLGLTVIALPWFVEPMQQRRRAADTYNFVDRILSPDNTTNPTKQVVERLAASAVPNAKAAEALAMRAVGGLDARETVSTTGLYYVEAPEHPEKLDLVWEVKTMRIPSVHRVVFVSATTGTVSVLFSGKGR